MLFSLIKNILFPKLCFGCGKLGTYLCFGCQQNCRYVVTDLCPYCEKESYFGLTHEKCRPLYGIDGVKSIFQYDGVVKKAIIQIKYRFVFDAVHDFLANISQTKKSELCLLEGFLSESVILPVPLHPDRYRYRGFNQAEKFSRLFAEFLPFPVKTDIIIRVKNTPPQAQHKRREDRQKNMIDAFSLAEDTRKKDVENKNFIVVDDVWTTGTTIKEIGKVLKKNGALKVFALTVAR